MIFPVQIQRKLPQRHYSQNFYEDAKLPSEKSKLRYVCLLTPQGIAERVALTSHFLDRKMQEYEALKAEIESLHQDVQQAGKPDSLKAS